MTDPFDVERLAVRELLRAYSGIMDELRRRGVLRSSNTPVSDYAEVLFCEAFGWCREKNSASGHDATDKEGRRYQIKGRRLTAHRRSSRQSSAIRNLDRDPFDFLAGVLVDDHFQVIRAAIMPISVVRARSRPVTHTNSHKFHLRDDIWTMPEVRDVTEELRAVASRIDELLRPSKQKAEL